MLTTTPTLTLADPAVTADWVALKVGAEVLKGAAVVAGAAVVIGLEVLPFVGSTVWTGVVVVKDPGRTVPGSTVPGSTVPGATVPGMTVMPEMPETVIDPPAATTRPAVAQPQTIFRVSMP